MIFPIHCPICNKPLETNTYSLYLTSYCIDSNFVHYSISYGNYLEEYTRLKTNGCYYEIYSSNSSHDIASLVTCYYKSYTTYIADLIMSSPSYLPPSFINRFRNLKTFF